jgi:HEPN domain-containing protein
MNPRDRKLLPVSPDEWMKHALSDLKFAKLGQKKKDILYQQICFHAQQAAEKALKAVLLYRKIDFPLTHDIEGLIDIFDKAGIPVPSDFQGAGVLTPYAVETRYPGNLDEMTEKEVKEAITLAEKIVKWAEENISKKNPRRS